MKKIIVLFLITLMCSCSSNDLMDGNNQQLSINNVVVDASVVPSTDFDWENVNSYNGLALPWGGAVQSFIPDSWRVGPPKKEDGWCLLYNTLDLDYQNVGKVLVFYNKYLSLLRIYFIADKFNLPGQKYALALQTTNSSKLLNNEVLKGIIVEPTFNASVIKSQPLNVSNVSASQGFVSHAWYGSEFYLSYDDTEIKSNSFLKIVPFSTSIVDVKMDGNTTGTITGVIKNGSVGNANIIGGLNLSFEGSNQKNQSVVQGDVGQSAKEIDNSLKKTKEEETNFFNKMWSNIKSEASGAILDGTGNLAKSLINKGIALASNPIMGLIDSAFGIVGQENSMSQSVDLGLKSHTIINGKFESSYPLGNFSFCLPTFNNISGFGSPVSSMKNYSLGVWCFKSAPSIKINCTTYKYFKYDYSAYPYSERRDVSFSHPENDPSIIINPLVLKECDVVEKKFVYSYSSNFLDGNSNNSKAYFYDIDNHEKFYKLNDFNGFDLNSISFDNYNIRVFCHVFLRLKNKKTGKEFYHVRRYQIKTTIEYKDENVVTNNSGGGFPGGGNLIPSNLM